MTTERGAFKLIRERDEAIARAEAADARAAQLAEENAALIEDASINNGAATEAEARAAQLQLQNEELKKELSRASARLALLDGQDDPREVPDTKGSER